MSSYNLLDEKWIPVLYHDGRVDRVGILNALKDAAAIRSLALPSSLDFFAVHRFMLTLLYWKADLGGGIMQVANTLIEDERVPDAVLDGIKREAGCFDLFHDTAPFLQDLTASAEKDKKPAGSLFTEMSTGTNIAHFHHGDDRNLRLCLSCTALGMLRVIPWTQAGGAGLTPSVHNAPPIMAMAKADNVAVTLGLNLVPLDIAAGTARWSGHFKPTNPTQPIPYMEAFTWNPRRIVLPLPEGGSCWYCGQTDLPTVGQIVYMKNEHTKKRQDKKLFEWQDPAAFYAGEGRTVKSTREDWAVSGRDLQYLIVKDSFANSTLLRKNESHEGWGLVIPCTNPANNKTFDHRHISVSSLSPETIRDLVPAWQPPRRGGRDGWKQPRRTFAPQGIGVFVHAAAELLTAADWSVISNASYRAMHESPAAFDILSGLYWGLRERRVNGLPSRNTVWLMLKLMALVPAQARRIVWNADFSPLDMLPKRQDRASPYPVSLPRGRRLEAALRSALDSNIRKRHPKPVDWIGLCHSLDRLLD